MALDALAQVQSRIDAIETQFADPAGNAGATSAASSAAADPADFASILAEAQMLGGLDASDSSSDPGSTATTDPGFSALGLTGSGLTGSGTPDLSGALSALSGASGLSGLSGVSGLSGLSGLSGTSSSSLSGLVSQLEAALSQTSGLGSSFLSTALSQAGKAYVFGATASPSDPSPRAFDCSELVQWAAARNGVQLPRTAGEQYLAAKQAGELVPVDVALRTPGALLFSFSTEPVPGGGEPSHAHVAISKGDGTTIEARGHAYGVGSWSAAHRFQYAAIIPGLAAQAA